MEPEEIQLAERNEIREMLGRPPSWILRWGMVLIGAVLVVVFVLAAVVAYPEVVVARVQLTTATPTIQVVARVSGKLERLLVKDQEKVKEGQLLGVLENTAVDKDVILLSGFMDSVPLEPLQRASLPESNLQLGRMQPAYAAFWEQWQDYQYYLERKGYRRQIRALRAQVDHLKQMNVALEVQEATLEGEVALARKHFYRIDSLRQKGALAAVDAENAERDYLQVRRQLEQLQTNRIANQVRMEELSVDIANLELQGKDELASRWLAVMEQWQNLKSALQAWKQDFWIVAPIDGQVSISRIWGSQQFVEANQPILSIAPESVGVRKIGRGLLAGTRTGRIEANDPVNIRLDAYPYREFGLLKGSVNQLAPVPEDGRYLLEVYLPDTLITTYGTPIPFRQDMEGTARIITEKRSILTRIFDRIYDLLHNR
jgi:multidrug resistance efflux pump